MDINCTKEELFILEKIAQAADELGIESYLIGGFVRDKILGRVSKDADIVCTGDGIELARKVAEKFDPTPYVNYFKNFGTAHIKVTISDNSDTSQVRFEGGELGESSFDLEFVGARKESYRYHSRKPDVIPGTIEDDQNRRDFTINAMAISLNKQDYGKLIDPFDGINDIKKKIIKTEGFYLLYI